MEPSRIFLIGYRGSGKTTVAAELARRLGYEWIDSDRQIEQQAGKSIADIFADGSESTFRDRESAVVAELCQRERAVLALGGGAVLREASRQRIAAAGPVVWLTASVATLAERIAADATTALSRPNLTGMGGQAEIEQVLSERVPIYRTCASLEVDTEGKTPGEIADEILRRLATDR